jgi:hypothetical protein
MLSALFAIIGLIKSFLGFKTNETNAKTQQAEQFWTYQTAFIERTSDVETRVVRDIIGLAFAIAMFNKGWGQTLTDNLKALPMLGQLIIGWLFFGAAILNIIPWYKNGSSTPNLTGPANPAAADPFASSPTDAQLLGKDNNK